MSCSCLVILANKVGVGQRDELATGGVAERVAASDMIVFAVMLISPSCQSNCVSEAKRR